ncbi:MAG: hypothetical protein OH324_03070 [Candidatus Parvarchaeota archaeon]|nr:hypothetical protein [Candidatus Rehaiarchaeum fermentans]
MKTKKWTPEEKLAIMKLSVDFIFSDIKNDNPYVFVGYVAWQDNGSSQYITPLIAMFNNIDKRFAFLNAKNHYFDPQVLKTDIQKLGIDINQIYKALE